MLAGRWGHAENIPIYLTSYCLKKLNILKRTDAPLIIVTWMINTDHICSSQFEVILDSSFCCLADKELSTSRKIPHISRSRWTSEPLLDST